MITETMANTLEVIDKTTNDIAVTNDKIQILTDSSDIAAIYQKNLWFLWKI